MAELVIIERPDVIAIADAVRDKTEKTGELTLGEIVNEINNIKVGVDTSDATATADEILSGKTAYVDGEKITGTIQTKTDGDITVSGATVTVPAGHYVSQATKSIDTATQATPSISVDSNGLITASADQSAGYVDSGTKSSTYQLAFQAAKTITPTTVSQTAVSSGYYTGGNVTVAGDSNLVAENIKNGVSIFGVSGNYEANGGGDADVEDSLITRTISTYTNDRVTKVGYGAFIYCSSLVNVSIPECTIVCSNAFAYCSKLISVDFPKCSRININAFTNCSSLTTVSFPECTYIDDKAFASCSKLVSVSFPKCSLITDNAFEKCSSLTTVNLPECKAIGGYAFTSCYKLANVSAPNCVSIGSRAFQYCSSITALSFPVCSYISMQAFYACSNLVSIYLMSSTVCTLKNSNAFSSTGIWSTKGSIFVPSSLVASYKAATNWAFFANRIYSA